MKTRRTTEPTIAEQIKHWSDGAILNQMAAYIVQSRAMGTTAEETAWFEGAWKVMRKRGYSVEEIKTEMAPAMAAPLAA